MAADGSVVIEITGEDKEFRSSLDSLGKVAGAALKGLGVAAAAAGAAVVALGKQAVTAYADYEQLVGGVETLFKSSAPVVEEYAARAFKTAGLSANDYMETVTSFSASLLQSLGGDTETAAKSADRAITDMADNANKMGTSMEAIQYAYQGFAKQNYTMLDNLKLGYGGTKEEMARLLSDAEKLSGQKYDISNLNDVYAAIHVIQTELGITGTTAKEASTTIQGSAASMKAAWANLLVGMADDTQDFDTLLENLIASTGTFAKNLLPRIQIALGGIAELASKLGPEIAAMLPGIASNLLPQIGEISVGIVTSLVNGIVSSAPTLLATVGQMVLSLGSSIMSQAPALMQSAVALLQNFSSGLRENLPILISDGLTMLISFSEGLRANVGLLVDAGLSLVMALADGIIQSLPALISNIPQIVTNIAGCINDNAPKLIATAAVLLGKLAIGLIQAIPTLIKNIPKIIEAIIAAWMAFNWISLGKQAITAIKDGILAMVGSARTAGKTVLDHIHNSLASLPGKLLELGKSGISGIINGFRGMLSSLGGAAKSILETVVNGITSLPAKVLEIGKQVIQGLINGLTSGIKAVGQAIGNIAGGILDKFKSALGIHSPSREFAILGEFSMEGYAIGLKNAEGKVIKTATELSESILEAATGWVDEKRYYNSLAAKDELTFWQELRNMAGLQAKELAKIDKSIYAAKVNASRESFEASKRWIEQEKFYHRLSAQEEVAAWERVEQRKNLLTEQQIEAEKNLYSAQQQLQEQQRESAKEYEDNLRARADSLRSFAGLFDEVKTNSEVTGRELLKNLRDQVSLFQGWQKDMETLTSRGVTGPLLEELRELGPRAAAEIKALTSLSDSELQEYVHLFAEKGKLASDEAEKELAGTVIELPVSVAVLSNEQAMTSVGNSVAAIGTAVAANTEKLKDTASTIASVMCETILSKHSDFYWVGVDAMRGLGEGLVDQGRSAIATARRIADSIIWEMQRALDIHSPSRKMRDLVGVPTAQGFMVGFEEEMAGLSKRMQRAIDAETSSLSIQAATQAEYKAANSGVTREVYRHNNTVEKLARVEGDGVTGELVRMLGLRLKTEDNRVGDSLVN